MVLIQIKQGDIFDNILQQISDSFFQFLVEEKMDKNSAIFERVQENENILGILYILRLFDYFIIETLPFLFIHRFLRQTKMFTEWLNLIFFFHPSARYPKITNKNHPVNKRKES